MPLAPVLSLPQHPYQHRPEDSVFLGVDQELGEGRAGLGGSPVGADRSAHSTSSLDPEPREARFSPLRSTTSIACGSASSVADEPLAEIDRTISALQDPTRRRILLDFYVHQAEWTTAEVAEAVGVHRTVAHAHLERLVALGYLVSGQRRGTSGKPAKLYRLTGRQIELSYPVRRVARLAAELAQALRGMSGGTGAARQAGRVYGASLVTKPAGSPESALHQLAPLATEYVLADCEIVARNCILREACKQA